VATEVDGPSNHLTTDDQPITAKNAFVTSVLSCSICVECINSQQTERRYLWMADVGGPEGARTPLAACDALERPRTQEQYERALSLVAVNLPKVIARRGGGVAINLSAAAARAIGLEAGKRVLVLPLPEGGGFLRCASEEDVRKAHARYAAAPQPCFASRPAPADLPEVEKRCPQCGLTFCTRRKRQKYCDACRHQRDLASNRASWRLKGKLTPSYRRKLKGARLASGFGARPAESPSLLFPD